MARTALTERLKRGVFFIDGAMGTQLVDRGMDPMHQSDYQNIESPELVRSVHEAYFEAGCDAVITNTFGANAISLKRHNLSGQAAAINTAGAKLAREAAGEGRYVIGDMGPCGDFIEPLGMVKADELREAFRVQAQALLEGGVDGFIIETMTALDEIQVGVEAVREVCGLPIFVSMAYDPAGGAWRTMMGVTPEQAVETFRDMGVTAVGFNCGTLSMPEYEALAGRMAELTRAAGLMALAEPNAGKPDLEDGRTVYTLSPEAFGESIVKIYESGVTILGGCCGTSPLHIAAAVQALEVR